MTHRSKSTIASRFTVTATGKVLHRKTGQDHFNAKEPSSVTRRKRRDVVLTKAFRKTIKQFLG